MFNDDPHMLTEAVMSGRKTQARYVVPASHLKAYEAYLSSLPTPTMRIGEFLLRNGLSKYIVGEEVAIAQSYETLKLAPDLIQRAKSHDKKSFKYVPISSLPGWRNKMYVSSEFMPHSIIITAVRVERLQQITSEDAKREGLIKMPSGGYGTSVRKDVSLGDSPRKAYASLINELCNKSVWDNNPYVYVYEFRFVK
mgnify:CR=1 FL=1